MRLAALLLALLPLAGCAEPPLWQAERGLVFCYRTLGDADCYPVPLHGEDDRLIAAGPEIYFTPHLPR